MGRYHRDKNDGLALTGNTNSLMNQDSQTMEPITDFLHGGGAPAIGNKSPKRQSFEVRVKVWSRSY